MRKLAQRFQWARPARLIAVNLCILAGISLLIEGCVRLTHPEIRPLGTDAGLFVDSAFADIPGPRPGASGQSNGAEFQVDDRGFWTYGSTPDSVAASWLLLGDSVTMGIGVAPDRTFAGIVAARFSSARVLNPSMMGYASDDYLTLLQVLLSSDRFRDLNIRRVTLLWCLNDVYGGIAGRTDPDHGFRQVAGPLLGFLQRNVFTYQWLKAVVFDRPRRYFEHDLQLYTDEHVEAAATHLKGIADLCLENDLQCDLVLLPYEYQLRERGESAVFSPQAAIAGRLGDTSIRVHDPSQYFQGRSGKSSELFLFGDGIHFSEKGHQLVADYLIDVQTRN